MVMLFSTCDVMHMHVVDKFKNLSVLHSFIMSHVLQLRLISCYCIVSFAGFGKSAIYQVAPAVYNKVHPDHESRVIIIELTIALTNDSICKINKMCPEMAAVHLTPATISRAKNASYIFSSPEMILSDLSRKTLLQDKDFIATVDVIFIDECHIIEEWYVYIDDSVACKE